MTEHMHEWDINWRGKFVYCKNTSTCGAIMTFEEVNRRLNATERLSAGTALFVQTLIPEQFMEQILALRAYAHALEGK